MRKKSIFFGVIFLLILVTMSILHVKSKPQDAPTIAKNTSIPDSLHYDQVNQYVYEQDEATCLFFFSSQDTDSLYMIEKILEPIMQSKGMNEISRLIYVDLADLDTNVVGEKYTKNNWGFFNCPTFLVMSINPSTGLEVSDKLEWDATEPFTQEVVTDWLKTHKLIK